MTCWACNPPRADGAACEHEERGCPCAFPQHVADLEVRSCLIGLRFEVDYLRDELKRVRAALKRET